MKTKTKTKTTTKTKTFRLTLPMPNAKWRDEIPHPDHVDLENESVDRLLLTPQDCRSDAGHVLVVMLRAIALNKLQSNGQWSYATREEKVEAFREAYRQLAEALGYVFEDQKMSYCRFSSDDFQSDVYVYLNINGWWYTEVASDRMAFVRPLPPRSPDGRSSAKRDEEVSEIFEQSEAAPIDLPHAGKTFRHATNEACAANLEELRKLGYHIPQYALDALWTPYEGQSPEEMGRSNRAAIIGDIVATIAHEEGDVTSEGAADRIAERLAQLITLGEVTVETDLSMSWALCRWPLKLRWGFAVIDAGEATVHHNIGWLPAGATRDLNGEEIPPHPGGWSVCRATSEHESSSIRWITEERDRIDPALVEKSAKTLEPYVWKVLKASGVEGIPAIEEPSSADVFESLDPPPYMDEIGDIGEEHIRVGKIGDAVVVAWAVCDANDEWHYFHRAHPGTDEIADLVKPAMDNYFKLRRKSMVEELQAHMRFLSSTTITTIGRGRG